MKQLSSLLCRLLTLLPLLAPAAGAAQAPALTAVNPGSGPRGSTLTLTGTNLTGLQSVLVGGVPAASFAVQSATQATAVVPRQAVSQRVRVSSPAGTALSAAPFQVTQPSTSTLLGSYAPLFGTNNIPLDVGMYTAPTVTDVDGDGLLDLLVGNYGGNVGRYEQTTANGRVFASLGPLTTDGSTALSVRGPATPTVTDLDGDGLLDLLVGSYGGNVGRYEQTTANGGVFASLGPLPTSGNNPLKNEGSTVPTVTDLDGDGLLDLLVGNVFGNVLRYEQTTANGSTFASAGTLTTDGSTALSVRGGAAAPAVTDLDGDGLLDLLVGNSDGNVGRYEQTTANGSVFASVGPVTFGGSTALQVRGRATPTVTDLDGDGLLELLVGNGDSGLAACEQQPSPVITGLSPGSGAVGRSVTITGANLDQATSVSFNGGQQTTITANTATSLTVAVPAGAATGPVTVTTAGGSPSSQPATVLRLQAAGGGDKTVYLDQVELLQNGAVVTGGVTNGSFETGAPAGAITYAPTTVSAWTFASNGGSAALSTTGSAFAPPAPPDGTAHLALLQNSAPYLEQALSLPSGTYQVRFQLAQRQCCTMPYNQAVQVLINGVALGAALTTTSTGYVQLTSNAFTVSNAGVFTVLPEPTIVSFSPGSGAVGSTISLTGTNLTGATAITFSGSGANVVTTGFTVASATSITGVVVPEGAATGPLTVTTGAGTSAASAASFTVCSVVARGQSASQALGAGGTATIAASAFDNGSTSACSGPLQPTLRKGGVAFGRVAENGALTLTAPAGYTFTAVDFASYGTPSSSSSGDYAFGACQAANSRRVVEAALLGQSGTVSIPATSANFGGDPCGGTPKFLAVRALYTRSPAAGSVAFGSVTEGSSLTLTAPAGTVFTGVSFASYGNPTGTGGNYVAGSCESANSRRVVEAALLGQSGTVLIPATNTNFGGDPCGGTPKTLAVRATYAPGGPTLVFDCTELGAQPVLLTLTDAAGARATTAVTATVSVPAQPTTSWTGNGSTDWTDCANWSYGLVPTASTSATLPAGRPRYPSLTSGTYLVQDLTIASGATLTTTSGATLQVSGDWLNNSAAVTVNGDVVFAGTTAQTIGGTAGTAFATVVVRKPGGTLTLGRDLAIGTRLTLTSGTLLTTDSYRVVLGSAATLDETDAAYVTGAVEATRSLSTAGSGSNFGGLGLTLTPAAGSAALPGSTLVRRTTGTPATGVGNSVGIGRYFDIQPTVDTGLDVSLIFSYFEHELNNIPEANLRLFKSTGTAVGPWAPQTPITADATANTVTKTGITDFSVWTLGNSAAPLPVELTAFTATAESPAARLRWTTASEKNSAYFGIERSLDGRTFTQVGQQPAQGSKASATAYTFLDDLLPASALASLCYYRLRQVDADGSFAYSPVRTVQLAAAAAGLSLYPNPAHGAATLTGASPAATVTVLDALGRVVTRATADAAGTATLTLPAQLPPGVYVVRAGQQAMRLTVE